MKQFSERVKEEYVYIAETDHIMLRPLPNLATPTVPAAFNFGYMVAWGQVIRSLSAPDLALTRRSLATHTQHLHLLKLQLVSFVLAVKDCEQICARSGW